MYGILRVKIALQKRCSIDFVGPKVFETPGEQEIMLFIWRSIGVIHVSLHVWKVNQQSPWFFFPSLQTKAHASWECGKRGRKSGIVGGGCWSTACPLWSATRWCVEWKMIRRSKRGTLGVFQVFSRWNDGNTAIMCLVMLFKDSNDRFWKAYFSVSENDGIPVYHPNCHFQRENDKMIMNRWI